MLIGGNNQEVIFEIEYSIIYVDILNKLILQPVIQIENAKVAVFVENYMCLMCRCMGKSNIKIQTLSKVKRSL